MNGEGMEDQTTSNEALLKDLQRKTFNYFIEQRSNATGLIRDSSKEDAAASITATGLALAAYPVAVERGFLSRDETVQNTLQTLRFFWDSPQGPESDATGYKGFYYHFLDMNNGRRAKQSELSTIDSSFLLAGMLTAAQYFGRDTAGEREIRRLAEALYKRVDWLWALNDGPLLAMEWTPEEGFTDLRWKGYSEALLLYVLGLGSPTHPLPADCYQNWLQSYQWRKVYGYEYLYAGPLFIHQLSHIWIDFRGIQDAYMREKCLDYFENSRRAVYVQREYARRNPYGHKGYGEWNWGITATFGPGPSVRVIDGKKRRFYHYKARGVPYGPDDGTLAPWACITSLPFAPEIVIPTIHHLDETYPHITNGLGYKCSFNPTFSEHSANSANSKPWVYDGYEGIDHGPIVLMVENYLTGLIWRLMRCCPPIVAGLQRAGFTGGWLESL
jgi:hypothetical protein